MIKFKQIIECVVDTSGRRGLLGISEGGSLYMYDFWTQRWARQSVILAKHVPDTIPIEVSSS